MRISVYMDEKRYFTGKPCSKGHIAERLKSNRTCVACANEKKLIRGKRPDVYVDNLKRLAEWEKANPHKKLARVRKRQASKLKRTPKWLTKADNDAMVALYEEAAKLSKETGIKYHVDHILPLQGKKVSGLHVPANLQVIPAKENLKKSNRHE